MTTEDQLYPNDGAPFVPTEPVEQINDRKEEKAETLQALPIIKDTIERFEAQIAHLQSINSIPSATMLNKEELGSVLLANKLASDKLTVEKEWLEDLIERHFENKR